MGLENEAKSFDLKWFEGETFRTTDTMQTTATIGVWDKNYDCCSDMKSNYLTDLTIILGISYVIGSCIYSTARAILGFQKGVHALAHRK